MYEGEHYEGRPTANTVKFWNKYMYNYFKNQIEIEILSTTNSLKNSIFLHILEKTHLI
jgi:N-dimethylarginine dimethylaminohydrolase